MTDKPTLADGLQAFFERTGYDPADYDAPWVALDLGLATVRIPNVAARQAVVACHDAHHVLTGYATDLAGESEQGAWEVASGCGANAVAWGLNLVAMSPGLVAHPRRTFRAFIRGRRCDNLYNDSELLPLAEPLDTLRQRLGISDPDLAVALGHTPTPADCAAFAVACGASAVLSSIALWVGPSVAVFGEVASRLSSNDDRRVSA